MPVDIVQTNSTQSSTGTSSVAAITYTAGNAAVVSLIFDNNKANIGTITQTAGDAVGALEFEMDSGGSYLAQYSTGALVGGSTTFTFTHGAFAARIWVTEITGQKTSGMFDVSATTTQTTSTTHSSGTTATLAQAAEIAIAVFNGDGSGATAFTSATNGFVVPTNGNQLGGGSATPKGILLYKVTAATTGVETTITTDNVIMTGSVGTYREAPAASAILWAQSVM